MRLEHGDVSYLGDSWVELAGLISRDGEFPFHELPEDSLVRLYEHGRWWDKMGEAHRRPGVSRLLRQVKAGEVPILLYKEDFTGPLLKVGEFAHLGGPLRVANGSESWSYGRDVDSFDLFLRLSKWVGGDPRRLSDTGRALAVEMWRGMIQVLTRVFDLGAEDGATHLLRVNRAAGAYVISRIPCQVEGISPGGDVDSSHNVGKVTSRCLLAHLAPCATLLGLGDRVRLSGGPLRVVHAEQADALIRREFRELKNGYMIVEVGDEV